ncbi:MAG: hypothetical protein ACOX57_15195 [Limnochordia bacterium]|jgi:hypothetical protein|nr:hypothetical protein [Bacillota bacterium]
MIHEFHIEDSAEIEVYRSKVDGSYTTKILLQDCYTTALVIAVPDGDILDELAHKLLMASLAMDDDLEEGDEPLAVEF